MVSPANLFAPVQAAQPPPTTVEHWIDVSNYQGYLDDAWFAHWSALGFGGLIVQAVTGTDGRTYTRSQLQAGLNHGWTNAGYIWVNYKQANHMKVFDAKLHLFDGFQLDFLANDVEEMQMDLADVSAALQSCDSYLGRPRDVWIYTRENLFTKAYGWANLQPWPGRKLWVANYDGIPDVNVGFQPFCGWTQAEMKQWTDLPLDQNVRRMP